MAKRLAIPSKELQLRVVGPRDSFFASRVQRLTKNVDVPLTVVDEIGNADHAGITTDAPNLTLTFSAFDVGIKIFSVLTGTDFTAYPAAGVNIDQLGEIDAILYVKDATLADYVKSAHLQRLQIRDFAFAYSVDGDSTEDYTAVGSDRRWFTNDVVVDKFTTGTTSFILTETPVVLKNGNYCLSVILDGEYLTEVASATNSGEYDVSGTTVTTVDSRSNQLIAVYQANPAGTNWVDLDDPQAGPASVRGKDVKIVIAANDIPRVQSVNLNGNMNPQPVRELGNRAIVGYQRQVPTVEGQITVLDTDTELVALFTTGSLNPADTEFQPGVEHSAVSLDIKLIDPATTSGVLKTLYIPEVRIVGDSFTQNVNDNAQQVFNFQSETAELFVYSGARP